MDRLRTIPYELLYKILLDVDYERIIACRTVSYSILYDTNFWLEKLDREQTFISESGTKHVPSMYVARYAHPDSKGINIYMRWNVGRVLDFEIKNQHNDHVVWKMNVAHPQCIIDEEHLSTAAACGNLELLKVFYEYHKMLFSRSRSMWSIAISTGHLPIVQWCYDEGVRPSDREIKDAVRHGQLHILQWFEQQGHTIQGSFFIEACESGRVDIMEWVHARGTTFSGDAGPDFASTRGKLELLQWFVKHGALPSTVYTVSTAARGHFHIIKWIIENKVIPLSDRNIEGIMNHAADHGRLDIIKLIIDNKIIVCTNAHIANIIRHATENGHTHIVEHFSQHRINTNPYCTAWNGPTHIVEYHPQQHAVNTNAYYMVWNGYFYVPMQYVR
jgi:hypothetical protein